MRLVICSVVTLVFVFSLLSTPVRAATTYRASLFYPAQIVTSSEANGISLNEQIGDGFVGIHSHAILWNSTPASAIDLNPVGFTDSYGLAVSGGIQVGAGRPGTSTPSHALMWSGSAASVVDLSPPDAFESRATGISGTRQFGLAFYRTDTGSLFSHALMWSGSAASLVDINPVGFDQTFLLGASASSQVGSGYGPATG